MHKHCRAYYYYYYYYHYDARRTPRATIGNRVVSVAAAAAPFWNGLPQHVTLSSSVAVFKVQTSYVFTYVFTLSSPDIPLMYSGCVVTLKCFCYLLT